MVSYKRNTGFRTLDRCLSSEYSALASTFLQSNAHLSRAEKEGEEQELSVMVVDDSLRSFPRPPPGYIFMPQRIAKVRMTFDVRRKLTFV